MKIETVAAPPIMLCRLPSNAMEMTGIIIIASTLPLTLLLLCALFEKASADGTRALSAAALERRDEKGWRFRGSRVDDLSQRLQRNVWVSLPGPVAVSQVPRGAQAEALEILSILDDLNEYFADGEPDPRRDGT